jgi:hypothetical protein
MGITIIIKDSKPKGESRTDTDKKLVDKGWGSSFKNPEDADKCAYLERKIKKHFGLDKSFVRGSLIEKVLEGR